jgi:hypothetical protein
MIINALIIIFLLWFLYQRFAPLKGIRQISTMELKAELKNKHKQFIDVRTPHEFGLNTLKDFETFLYQNCRRKQANFQKTEK